MASSTKYRGDPVPSLHWPMAVLKAIDYLHVHQGLDWDDVATEMIRLRNSKIFEFSVEYVTKHGYPKWKWHQDFDVQTVRDLWVLTKGEGWFVFNGADWPTYYGMLEQLRHSHDPNVQQPNFPEYLPPNWTYSRGTPTETYLNNQLEQSQAYTPPQ